MKKVSLILVSLFTLFSYGQRINEYEFAVISTKFQFQRTEHEYRLNALLKDRLQDFGFQTFYKSDPVGSAIDPCLCLDAEVVNVSNIFLTKLQIVFKDCTNGIVFQSEIGTSESKDRYESFNEALFNALRSVRNLNYKFNGVKSNIAGLNQNTSNPVQINQVRQDQLKAEDYLVLQTKIEDIKVEYALIKAKLEQAKQELAKVEQAKNAQSKVQQVALQNTKVDLPKASPQKVVQEPVNLANVPIKSAPEKAQNLAKVANNSSEIKKPTQTAITAEVEDKTSQASVDSASTKSMFVEKTDGFSKEVLFASPVENGYQLIDSTEKVVLVLVNTLQPDYYNATIDKKFGVVYKKIDQWVFEYYQEGKLVVEPLKIRF